jgi:class 3 adenylate cyclase
MQKADTASKAQRRLAAIFSADVEGYARLMNADEGGTLNLLSAHRDITDRLMPVRRLIANTAATAFSPIPQRGGCPTRLDIPRSARG